MVSQESLPSVGARILVKEKDFGTVKYVGKVQKDKTDSIWLGIDWDDPKRGKHDGSVDNIRYFTASGPTSGSFIKPHPSINLGIDVNTALNERYRSEDHVTPDQEEINSLRRQLKASLYEVVGFEKFRQRQKNFSLLTVVDLSNRAISGGKLPAKELRKVVDVSLASNLLSSWETVHEMVKELPRLETLELNFNRFNFEGQKPVFKVKRLGVSSCFLNWENVEQIAAMFPNLVALTCSSNRIKPSGEISHLFPHLEELDISSNPVETPESFSVLGKLPTMKLLRAQSINLTSLKIEEGDFPELRDLSLHENFFTKLSAFDELRKVGNLRAIRVSGTADEKEMAHVHKVAVVAKLPQVTKINGWELTGNDRRDAELDYLRLNSSEWFLSAQDPERRKKFLEEHSNYPDIIQKHGEPANTTADARSSSLSSRLLELTIVTPDNPLSNPIKRKLPKDMSVGKLKGSLARTCHRQATDMTLFVCPSQAVHSDANLLKAAKEALEIDDRPLNFYVSPGDVIVVKWL